MIRLTKKVVLMGCLLLPLAAQAGQLSEAEFKAQELGSEIIDPLTF